MAMCKRGVDKVTGLIDDAIENALNDCSGTILQKIKQYLNPAYAEAIDKINDYIDSEIESHNDEEAGYDAGYEEGHNDGYEEAKGECEKLAIPCPFCNKPLDFIPFDGILRCRHGNEGCGREFNLTERK